MKLLSFLPILTFLISINAFSFQDNSFYIGDPMPFYKKIDQRVKSEYPNAKLLFISTFGLGNPDPYCSQIGWQFIYQDDSLAVGIRSSIRHKESSSGACEYIKDNELDVDKDDYPIIGYASIEGKLDRIKVLFKDAIDQAISTVGFQFKPYWAKLFIPLHPRTEGRIFWNFKGPMSCNKGSMISIDSDEGSIAPFFSRIQSCD